MRIFIGLTDVANITATYAKGFRALGHEVFSVVWNKSYFYPDSEYEIVIDRRTAGAPGHGTPATYLQMAAHLAGILRASSCELFILFAPAVLPTQIYYPLLKGLGRKILTAFWGSDIRHWYAFAEEMKSLGVQDEVGPFIEYARTRSGGSFRDKQRTVKVAERYSDVIISQPDCAQLQTRPYMRAAVPLDLSEYEFRIPGRSQPLILHAPSVPDAKGTDVVTRAIHDLQAEGLKFQFRLIEKMPNRALRELLTDSDIVVDELYSATVGGLSAEAMAAGNAVLVRYMQDYCKVPPRCPAINVNRLTLKDKLRELIRDVDRRKQLAALGRPYVEAANDHVRICARLLDWIDRKDDLLYDFHPTFHAKLNLPEDILLEEERESGRRRARFFKTLLSTGTTKGGQ